MSGARPHPERQRKGPLKVIVKVLRRAPSKFEPGIVLLECGHRVRSNSTGRARCDQCMEAP